MIFNCIWTRICTQKSRWTKSLYVNKYNLITQFLKSWVRYKSHALLKHIILQKGVGNISSSGGCWSQFGAVSPHLLSYMSWPVAFCYFAWCYVPVIPVSSEFWQGFTITLSALVIFKILAELERNLSQYFYFPKDAPTVSTNKLYCCIKNVKKWM